MASKPLLSVPTAGASQQFTVSQLGSIKAQLDLVLLALESLLGVTSEAMLEAALQLGLENLGGGRVGLWRLRQANPFRKGEGRKKLDVEEAHGLALVVVALAQQHQAHIRRAVTLLEDATLQDKPIHHVALLGDYLDTFTNLYQERMIIDDALKTEYLRELALTLLIDLLFYSQTGGKRRLWLALLERAR